MKTKIVNSWAQADGGTRYEVQVGQYTVTVDRKDGKLTGFVRGSCSNEDAVLSAAFAAVKENQ